MTNMSKALYQPWPGLYALGESQKRRVTVVMPTSVAERLDAVYGGAGFITALTHTIIHAIDNELTKRNISTYNPECLIDIVRRCTSALTVGHDAGDVVPGSPKGLRSVVAACAKRPNTKGKASPRRRGGQTTTTTS